MSEKFSIEIINPDSTILKSETTEVIIPAFEGLMTILKNHISLVTFLRPGFIAVKLNNKLEKFYIEEGTVEFSHNKLLILSSTVKNINDFAREEAIKILDRSKKLMITGNLKDKDKYILSYKVSALEEITQ